MPISFGHLAGEGRVEDRQLTPGGGQARSGDAGSRPGKGANRSLTSSSLERPGHRGRETGRAREERLEPRLFGPKVVEGVDVAQRLQQAHGQAEGPRTFDGRG